MCIIDKKCHAWISLESAGIPTQGCLKNSSWLNSIVIPCSQSVLNSDAYINLPNEKLIYKKNVAHGKFGYIDSAIYDNTILCTEVYVKRPIIPGKSLLYEACIQKVVRDNMVKIGFPNAAPNILNIFRLKDNSVCFSMEQIFGAVTLNNFLKSIDNTTKFTEVIICCLLQLSAVVWHLNSILGINHRDLNTTNFLITEHASRHFTIQIDNNIMEIESKYCLTFIDFGFSCLGSTDTHISDISLSTVYSKDDPCPKEGRDMFLFIAFLYVDYHDKLAPKLLALFESWLYTSGASSSPNSIAGKSNFANFIKKDKQNAIKWIYFIAGNEKIVQFSSSPSRIIKDIQGLLSLNAQ